MSINIHIIGSRPITYTNGKGRQLSTNQEIKFPCWQTPSGASREIMTTSSPIAGYQAWVRSQARVEKIGIYHEHDIFCEGPVIGYDVICAADDHLEQLDSWLKMCDEEGYKVTVEAW
jgi:hypothetical protein